MSSIELQKKSSALTMSDMELFVFPELMFALVLANIMSPRIWKWREDPWFVRREKKAYRRITRLKQYVIDHYAFNLDLDTWGLTTKERELARFRGHLDEEALRQSNALFGYEGDKYYFDIDIRTHFGLDKYEGDVIPYWKTETVEAMDAFRFRSGFSGGAGECVSLAGLYAAALFVAADIPLQDIYLMATPLHSQNFIDVDDGVLTNNRRLVTRNMWFNGTALSAQARRALENERVTIVAHESGFVHTLYRDATIDAARYSHFAGRLRSFLQTDLTSEILGSFLRHAREIQKCFQVRWPVRGTDQYAAAERVFQYEHDCPYLLTDSTRDKLLAEVDPEEFQPAPLPGRIVFNDLEDYVKQTHTDLNRPDDVANLRDKFACDCLNAQRAIDSLVRFCRIEPRLPRAEEKQFLPGGDVFRLNGSMGREEIVARVESMRGRSETADLAFYAYRDLNRTAAEPYLEAAIRRSPVSIEGARGLSDDEVIARLRAMADESIYDGEGRLAQPDEVWNYGRGDGAEKAVLAANVFRERMPDAEIRIEITSTEAVLQTAGREARWASSKGLRDQVWNIGPR